MSTIPSLGNSFETMSTSVYGDIERAAIATANSNSALNRAAAIKEPRFALVIPALNEEDAIGSTLEGALAARREVIEKTGITDMQILLVNDGSTDGTQEIADRHSEIIKIRFEKNRGYGAAIKAGFQATDAAFVGFMDADGTCDPRFCGELIKALILNNADVAVGSRMNVGSEMPLLRRVGNLIFAQLIGTVSGRALTDCASGMRVLRRASLRYLHPLPDGLHFTPAMTCLALFNPHLRIVEVSMPYKERIGRSKLRVIRDGFKFLFTILFTAALFNPIKSLATFGALFLIFGSLICLIGTRFVQSFPALSAWCAALVAVMMQAVFVGFLSHQAMHIFFGPRRLMGFGESPFQRFISTKKMICFGSIIGGLGFVAYSMHGAFPAAWQTIVGIGGAIAVVFAGWTALAGVLLRVIWTANERRDAERDDPYTVARK